MQVQGRERKCLCQGLEAVFLFPLPPPCIPYFALFFFLEIWCHFRQACCTLFNLDGLRRLRPSAATLTGSPHPPLTVEIIMFYYFQDLLRDCQPVVPCPLGHCESEESVLDQNTRQFADVTCKKAGFSMSRHELPPPSPWSGRIYYYGRRLERVKGNNESVTYQDC